MALIHKAIDQYEKKDCFQCWEWQVESVSISFLFLLFDLVEQGQQVQEKKDCCNQEKHLLNSNDMIMNYETYDYSYDEDYERYEYET